MALIINPAETQEPALDVKNRSSVFNYVEFVYNPDMKQFYDRLINAGKPAKVAFTAIMRKLILLANLLIKSDRKWMKMALD